MLTSYRREIIYRVNPIFVYSHSDGYCDMGYAADPVSEECAFYVVIVTRVLEYPWILAFLPNGRRLVTEQMLQGALGHIRDVRSGPDGYL